MVSFQHIATTQIKKKAAPEPHESGESGKAYRDGLRRTTDQAQTMDLGQIQCVVCKTQVGSKPFIIPNETDVYCVGCFEEKFATKCTKCKKIMTTGGVTFKNEVQKISLLF